MLHHEFIHTIHAYIHICVCNVIYIDVCLCVCVFGCMCTPTLSLPLVFFFAWLKLITLDFKFFFCSFFNFCDINFSLVNHTFITCHFCDHLSLYCNTKWQIVVSISMHSQSLVSFQCLQ